MVKWDHDSVIAEGRKYIYSSDFERYSKSAYITAVKNRWLGEMYWFIPKHKKWTDQEVIDISRLYRTKSEFKDNNINAYQYAVKHKLIGSMVWLKPKVHRWTEDELNSEISRYSTLSDFIGNNPSAYRAAKKLGIPLYFDGDARHTRDYTVYCYDDKENMAVYVGLTCQPKRRRYEHTRRNSPVYRYFCSAGKDIPEPVYLESCLDCTTAQERERYYIDYYRSSCYTVLNKAKTGAGSGSLGSRTLKWTDDNIIAESKKYKTIKEFRERSGSAYRTACKNGLIKRMTWLDTCQFVWTDDLVLKEASKYKSLSEFKRCAGGAYRASLKLGMIGSIPWLKRKRTIWDSDKLMSAVRRCGSYGEFVKNRPAYTYAYNNGLLDMVKSYFK